MRRPHRWQQWALIAIGLVFTAVMLVLPLSLILAKALAHGWHAVMQNLHERDMRHAIGLTLLATAIAVPVNVVFGTLLAWCVAKYNFRGRSVLRTLLNIPVAMSPIVAGMCYLLLYGTQSALGRWLVEHDIRLMFAWPGVVLVTVFVTCPYVAQILIPLFQQQGNSEEEAALALGASGWQMFRQVTLPNIKWALLYGVVQTNARAVGEFGAVSVVSGTIRGQTLTLPLHVELLHQDYNSVGAFTAAALLAGFALLTLALKTWFEWRQQQLLAKSELGQTGANNALRLTH